MLDFRYNMLNGRLPFRNEKDICTAHLLGPLPYYASLSSGMSCTLPTVRMYVFQKHGTLSRSVSFSTHSADQALMLC